MSPNAIAVKIRRRSARTELSKWGRRSFQMIKRVSKEQGYSVSNEGALKFELEVPTWHGTDYRVLYNSGSGYIEVSFWQHNAEEYGPCAMSIRNHSGVIKFCNIITALKELHPKRDD